MRSGWNLWILLAYLSVHHSLGTKGLSCIEVKQPRSQCDVLNISSREIQPLIRPPVEFDLLMLQIDRISLLYPDGEIALMLGRNLYGATYYVYYDNILRIPANCQLKNIILKSAPRLETIKVSSRNNVLEALYVHESIMRRIPTSFQHLQRLQCLLLKNGVLQTFNLEPLEGIRNITFVDLSFNMLHRLEGSRDPKLIMPIEKLDLSYNQLEFIDMEFFIPFKRLNWLQLNSNQLKQITATKPIVLPLLGFVHLDFNELTLPNFSKWFTPKLTVLNIKKNNLTQLPVGIDRLTNLVRLDLSHNQLTTLDLQELESLQILGTLYLFYNQLHNVLPDCRSRMNNSCQLVSLPALHNLDLQNNELTSIDFKAWDFPSMHSINLSYNRLKRILNMNNKFPKLEYLYINHNDIYCLVINGTARPKKGAFDVQETTDNTICPSNSSFPHPYAQGVVCCNE